MAKIAIIGASYLQVPLVKTANKLGHQTICFAWEEGAVAKKLCSKFYPISILDKEEILAKCLIERIDAILTIASDKAVPTVSFVAKKMGLIGNSLTSSIKSTNKYLMRQAFLDADIQSPNFIGISKNDKIDLGLFLDMKYPLIVKPVDSSGSNGISIVNDSSGLIDKINIARIASFCGDVIVEEFIEGREVSVEVISFEGEHHILTITDKKTSGPPHFVELEHHQPTNLPSNLQYEIKLTTLKGLEALELSFGASHSEFIITRKDQVYITEIGARMGGDFIGSDLVKLSTGYDFLKATLEVALGHFQPPVMNKKNYSGIYYLSSETKWIKPFIDNSYKYPFIIRTEILDNKNETLAKSSDRNGYLIYQSNCKVELPINN